MVLQLLSPAPVQAICQDPTCSSFEPATFSTVTRFYNPLASQQYFQFAIDTDSLTPFTVSGISYSYDNVSFNSFSPGSLNVPAGTGAGDQVGTRVKTGVVNKGSAIGNSLYIRFTIPGGNVVEDTATVNYYLYANSNGTTSTSSGFLRSVSGNAYTLTSESTTAQAVPLETDALPVVISGVFMAGGLWLKRRHQAVKTLDLSPTEGLGVD